MIHLSSPIRSEQWKLAYAIEATPGTDPSRTSNTGYTNTFGVVQNVTMPDPQMDIQPFWGLGTASYRNWFVAYHGKQTLNGSIGSFILLDGKCLRLPIGTVSPAAQNIDTSYTHIITEAVTLPTISMHTTYVNADGTIVLMRRFHGGKVNRMTLSAQEGQFLMCSIDDMQFTGYKHGINPTGLYATGYDYATDDPVLNTSYNAYLDPIAHPSDHADIKPMTDLYKCDQPYLFAYGYLQLWGTTFARIRGFSLSIDNGCQAKYYVQNATSTLPLPYEIREGKRQYSLQVTVDIEDNSLYRELLRMGQRPYLTTPPGTYDPIYSGFTTTIGFIRGTVPSDYIQIVSPSTSPTCGGDAMGCLIKTAPHNISTGDLLVGVPLSISCRNLEMVVTDSYSAYL